MTIFKNKSKDKYGSQRVISKSVRMPKDIAVKIVELQEVCNAETGEYISQNTILLAIINNYINDLEIIASQDEDKATAQVISIINKSN